MKTLKYSRQRESIKSCLMGRRDHPTADDVYLNIRQEYPNISLGTVYRNLNLLVELGQVQKLSFGYGPDRFDADLTPHYHFVCRKCGCVTDLPLKPFSELDRKAQQHCDGSIDSHLIYFYGLCKACSSSGPALDGIVNEAAPKEERMTKPQKNLGENISQ